jgi:hypothetical protein
VRPRGKKYFPTTRHAPRLRRQLRPDVAKLDDEHASSRAVLGNLQKFDNAGETGIARQRGRNVGKGNLEDLRYDDVPRGQCIAAADFDVRPLPQANGGRNLSVANAIAKTAEELHGSPTGQLGRGTQIQVKNDRQCDTRCAKNRKSPSQRSPTANKEHQ